MNDQKIEDILSGIKKELEPLRNLGIKHVGKAIGEVRFHENIKEQTQEMIKQTREMGEQTRQMKKQTKWLFWTFLAAITALILNIVIASSGGKP